MRASTQPVLLALTLAMSACTYVSQSKYEDKLCTIDADDDGFARCGDSGTTDDGDCDDDDPLSFPGGVELPYDGVDQDCDGVDFVDVDGDKSPGVTFEAFLAEHNADGDSDAERLLTKLWPSGLGTTIDCDDNDADAKPGNTETHYDGIDGDCRDYDGDLNDWDNDHDGYLHFNAEDVEEFGAYVEKLATATDGFDNLLYTGFAAKYGSNAEAGRTYFEEWALDCQDARFDVNPGQTVDAPYDVDDADCDEQNDFDQDDDGHMVGGQEANYGTFTSGYVYATPWPTYWSSSEADAGDPKFDCLDMDDASIPHSAVDVYPGATDVPYDGYDTGCDDVEWPLRGDDGYDTTVTLNDFDADGDGFMAPGYRAEFIAYVQRYQAFTMAEIGLQPYYDAMLAYGNSEGQIGQYYDLHNFDCQDDPTTNPLANAIHPGAYELIGDGTDQDCDGGDSSTAIDWGDAIDWTTPGQPRVAETANHFILALTFEERAQGTSTTSNNGTMMWFDKGLAGYDWHGIDHHPYSSADFIFSSNVAQGPSTSLIADAASDDFYVAYTSISGGSTVYSNLNFSEVRYSSVGAGSYSVGSQGRSFSSDTSLTYSQVDVRESDGSYFVAACGDNGYHWAEFTHTTSLTRRDNEIDNTSSWADCFVMPADVSESGLDELNFGSRTGVTTVYPANSPSTGAYPTLTAAHSNGDWTVLARPTTGAWVSDGSDTFTILGSYTVASIDVGFAGSTMVAAAVVDGSELVIAYGNPTSGMTTDTWPVQIEGVDATPVDVALYANNDKVMIAITATDGAGDEHVGWAFLDW